MFSSVASTPLSYKNSLEKLGYTSTEWTDQLRGEYYE